MITSEWPTVEKPNSVPFLVRQVDLLRQNGVNVDVYHFRGNKNPINYFFAWIKVREKIKQKRYDILHAQWGQSALLCLPKKMPLVVTFRGDDVYGIAGEKSNQTFRGLVLSQISRLVAKTADKCIVVSKELAIILKIQDFHVIPSGIDLDLFYPIDKIIARKILNLPDKDLVLFVGNQFNPVKRLPLIKKAIQIAKKKNTNLELLCLGDITHDEVPLYMNACDVLILASIHEGSPNVVKEALACNLPIVSTNVGDVSERISKVQGCIICNDDLPDTIAKALLTILAQKKRIDGRDSILELDEKILVKNLIYVYEQTLDKSIIS